MKIDIQGFCVPEFTPKELVIYNGYQTAHFLFKPPKPFHTLSSDVMQQIIFIQGTHLCIPYASGNINLNAVPNILKTHVEDEGVDRVYVKGQVKKYCLDKMLGACDSYIEVINIEQLEDSKAQGSYIQVGDIVSVQAEDDRIFYAQIRGLLIDQYCEKSAVITWLLPTQESPPPNCGFDPATYIIGPEEELPRKLKSMEFIMHAPSDYYKSTTPYPVVQAPLQSKYIWTSLQPIKKLCKL